MAAGTSINLEMFARMVNTWARGEKTICKEVHSPDEFIVLTTELGALRIFKEWNQVGEMSGRVFPLLCREINPNFDDWAFSVKKI